MLQGVDAIDENAFQRAFRLGPKSDDLWTVSMEETRRLIAQYSRWLDKAFFKLRAILAKTWYELMNVAERKNLLHRLKNVYARAPTEAPARFVMRSATEKYLPGTKA